MALDVQRIIGQVAERHGVLLGPDDPAFYSLYLYEAVLEETIASIEEARDAWRDDLLLEVRATVAGNNQVGPRAINAASAALVVDIRREIAVIHFSGRRVLMASLACLGASILSCVGTAVFWLTH